MSGTSSGEAARRMNPEERRIPIHTAADFEAMPQAGPPAPHTPCVMRVRTGRFIVVDSIKPRSKKKALKWPSGVEGVV